MNITKEFDNKLLHRKEIVATLEAESTPSEQKVREMLTEKFKKPEEQIVVETIKGKFGSRIFEISAKIYDDAESLRKYETVSKKERKKRLKEAEEKAKTKSEAKKSEAEETKKTADENIQEPKEPEKEIEEKANPDKEPKTEEVSKNE